MNPVTRKDQKTRKYFTLYKRKFYGKISGNHLRVYFPLFLRSSVNIRRNHHTEQGKIEGISQIRPLFGSPKWEKLKFLLEKKIRKYNGQIPGI